MITDIHLQNFRSYENESFELSPDVNIVVGPNASGKTNLLESLLVISRGGSYRAKDTEIIMFNKDWARIEANTENFNRTIKLQKLSPEKIDKTYEINTKKLKRINISQTIPVVLFEPNHLRLLIGSPELRRNYLDEILEQTVVGFKTLKSQFRRALAQRNMLLKSVRIPESELFVWNIRMSEIGGKLFRDRANLIDEINKTIKVLYNSISGSSEDIKLIYKTNINTNNYETDLLKKLDQSLENDKIRGFTSHGPHRDDVEIVIDNKLAGDVASRGETRTILLALKMIETQVIEKARQQKPLLLFDDVFSELDGSRRMSLVDALKKYQTIITTTDADVVIQHFTDSAHIIPL